MKRRKVEEKVMDIPIRDCVVDITMCSVASSRSVASVKTLLLFLRTYFFRCVLWNTLQY